MELGLKIILVLVALVIIAGLVWDLRKNSAKKRNSSAKPTISKSPRGAHQNYYGQLSVDLEDPLPFEEADEEFNDLGIGQVRVVENSRQQAPLLEEEEESQDQEPEIIMLQVMARRPNLLSGKKLLDALHEAHLYFGEREIFHRHENTDGTGSTVFSLVSAVEPGYFELSKMESLKTPGLVLFFTVTRPNRSVAAFELMLRTARQLALRLDADLKDDKQQLLTAFTIENYRERIRYPAAYAKKASRTF